jgi:peroxiredoxin
LEVELVTQTPYQSVEPIDWTKSTQSSPDAAVLKETLTQLGKSLEDHSMDSPVLLVFLRHLGCTFCRETLSDIAAKKESLRRKGIQPIFVHMSSDQEAAEVIEKYGMGDAPRISDPDRNLYKAFGLQRGGILEVLGPKVWLRGFLAAIIEGHGFGKIRGDAFQLPGVFLLHKGQILKDFRHKTAADRPDYARLEPSS